MAYGFFDGNSNSIQVVVEANSSFHYSAKPLPLGGVAPSNLAISRNGRDVAYVAGNTHQVRLWDRVAGTVELVS